MRRAGLAAALTLVAVLGAAPLVGATSGSFTDPAGDTESRPADPAAVDITRVSFGHTSDGRLFHKVTVAGTMRDLVPFIYLEMRERSSASAECDIYVGTYDGRFGVYACGTNERLGSVRVTKRASSIKYVFKRGAIGNPRTYDWAAGVTGPSFDTQFRFDRAPDGDDIFFTHALR
jgi:hypothetical protein